MDKVLIFIPCLNAEKTITKVLDRMKNLKFKYNLLIVDNNSSDRTREVLKNYIGRNKFAKCSLIKNPRNLGYGGSQKVALKYGISKGYDYLIVIHADGQYPIEYSGKLIEAIKNYKCSLVVGSRIRFKGVKKVMPTWRYTGNRILTEFNKWAYGINLSDYHSEFRIYDLKFMKKVNTDKWSNQDSFTLQSLLGIDKKKGQIREIPIPCSYPEDAHHPPILNLIWYSIYTIIRGFKYKILMR